MTVPNVQKLVSPALLAVVLLSLSAVAAARQATDLGQISGIASAQDGGALPNALAQLRDLDTGEVIGTVATNADGQFIFVVMQPGNYVVEIVNAQGAVVATTAAITLTPAAMRVSSATVTAPPSAANSAASPTAAGGGGANSNANTDGGNTTTNSNTNGNSNGSGNGGAIAAGNGGGVFTPTSPYVSTSTSGSGSGSSTIPGTVPPTQTASASR